LGKDEKEIKAYSAKFWKNIEYLDLPKRFLNAVETKDKENEREEETMDLVYFL
jgi:hypothetical protein